MAGLSQQQEGHASNVSGPIVEDITELCDNCVKVTGMMLKNDQHDSGKGRTLCVTRFFEPNITQAMCRFCEIRAKDRCTKDVVVATYLISDSDMGRRWSSGGPRYSRICAARIDGHNFALWADSGSAACASLVDRAPILGPHMDQVCELAQHRLKMCSTHDKCRLEDEMLMPTRVLALCGDHARPSVRLVETRGQKGRYIALSHCWGSTGSLPLRTTSKSFEQHRNGIPFGALPKTFQDCVEFSQGMGVKYIWIDSLCIVQDDHEDWRAEASRMRDVYRNAVVVVAASGAKDSSEGLFISNRPRARVIRLPYCMNGETQGTFNMMQLPRGFRPKSGPLERRAWTLQERYLARRYLAFMPHNVTWVCKESVLDEPGRTPDDFNFESRWLAMLHSYTSRSLTVPSDRIEAIKGIAEDLQYSRKDRYIPEYGVWEEKLALQLLWFGNGPPLDDGQLSHIPSWSWLATKDAKVWPYEWELLLYETVEHLEEMPEQLEITSRGHLHLFGHLSAEDRTQGNVLEASTVPDLELKDLHRLHYYRTVTRSARIITQDMHDACNQAVLGIVRFDDTPAGSCTHVCFLAKQKRKKWEDIKTMSKPPFVQEQTIGNVVYHTEQKPLFVYWVLLLEKVGESRFKRVGMGTLLPAAYEAFQVQLQEFEII